ncbi:MAG: hypothetical protein HC831_19020 [Chloroflexia bacterium]|nr:hypothetical protein [Chloroflexia bacterium]
MINAVFDLSNLWHRSMYVVGGFGSKSYMYESQKEIDELMRKVAIDISAALRSINPSRIVFAIDSRSWRKKIEIEENDGYKSNRAKTGMINWDNIYATMDEFTEIMASKGMIVSKIENAEADDLMCLWRDKFLFGLNEHVVLVSGDEDIRQLSASYVSNDGSKKFATIFNPFTQGKNPKKLFAPKEFSDWLTDQSDVGDIFSRGVDPAKDSFIGLLNSSVKFEAINGDEIAIKKVFQGDDGDCVPPIYTWVGKTSGGNEKTYRITASTQNKIIEKIWNSHLLKNNSDIMDVYDLPSLHEDIYEAIGNIAKHKPSINMEERIKRQLKLVVLSRQFFPDEIVEEFDDSVDDQLAKKPDQVNGWYVNTLLEGTRYIDENYQRNKNEASIFRDIDAISQKLF